MKVRTSSRGGKHQAKRGTVMRNAPQDLDSKQRRPYEMMTISPIRMDTDDALLKGSIVSAKVEVADQVVVTDFTNDTDWSSDKFEIDF